MALIGRVWTKSGAAAVQIAEYRDGRQRIVKHIGSAHTEVELGVLIEQAEHWPAGLDQGGFPLDVPKLSTPAPLLAGPVEPSRFSDPASASDVMSPMGVLSVHSPVLFEALAVVNRDLGFHVWKTTCSVISGRRSALGQ